MHNLKFCYHWTNTVFAKWWQNTLIIWPNSIINLYIYLFYSKRYVSVTYGVTVNTLRPRQNGRHFADDTFKCLFLNENIWIPIKISLKIVPKGSINNIPALVQIMAWRLPGDKPLSEPMLIILLTHICVTRPQWVNCTTWGPLFIHKYYTHIIHTHN